MRNENHVTRQLRERVEQIQHRGGAVLTDLPVLAVEHLSKLAAQFPPRCLRTTETVEDHLRYAGKVELVAALVQVAAEANPQKEADGSDDELGLQVEPGETRELDPPETKGQTT